MTAPGPDPRPGSARRGAARWALRLGLLAVPVAVARFFLQGWLDPLGIPAWLGSLAASLWLLLGVALVILFGGAGRDPAAGALRAAGAFVLLAAWCEVLVIAGILISEAAGMETYYRGPFERVREAFPDAASHAAGHLGGFFPRTLVGLVLGAIVFRVARRRARRTGVAPRA